MSTNGTKPDYQRRKSSKSLGTALVHPPGINANRLVGALLISGDTAMNDMGPHFHSQPDFFSESWKQSEEKVYPLLQSHLPTHLLLLCLPSSD